MLADIPLRTFDDKAMTANQVAEHMDSAISTARLFCKKKVKEGIWEQCWKRVDNRVFLAYRSKKSN
jgi:hypothetical protein